jgi:hypothetical protein
MDHIVDAPGGDQATARLELPRHVIASRLSIKPETFSRVFKQLTDAAAISVHGAHVTLIDRPALVEMAELADTPELGTTGCSPAPDRRSG